MAVAAQPPSLRLVLTEAGITRFTAAQLGQPIDLSLARVGLTASTIVVSPTLTALPGEHRRLATLSGRQVGRDVAHLIVRDDTDAAYTVRGIGLYLADGTLFAVYAQGEPIVGKSIGSAMLLALDIAFPANSTAAISFGNTDFLNPPATDTAKGVVELATATEADAGIAGALVITAAVLKGLIDPIRTSITTLLGRKVQGGGIVTGGGTLAADRTLTVTAASAAEADAGVDTTKALVPSSLANILARLVDRVQPARTLTAAGLVTGGGDLTADRTFTVTAATAAEADAGVGASKALVPASLVNMLARLADRVQPARRVGSAGLVTGGGDLTADRTLTVTAASAAEILAGTDDTRAVTPLGLASLPKVFALAGSLTLPGGLIVKWGRFTAVANGTTNVAFNAPFPSFCFAVVTGGVAGTGLDSKDNPPGVVTSTITQAGFSVFSADEVAIGCNFIALGV